jgi:ureidoglycolate lyase
MGNVAKLLAKPLTQAGFALYGEVVEAAGVAPKLINQGFAKRFNNLCRVDVDSTGGSANVSLFTAQPRPMPIRIALMERHPLGSQAFIPLQNRPWHVLVCDDPRDTKSYHLFEASGQQGVNYGRNVWHHPLLVTDANSRFLVIDRQGPGENLEEVALPTELKLELSP